ncbi:hypothetical protein EYC98_03585 [Halieaceae bacterium IMCC14734]|uniref:Uncharacterized protein n=1 Tax=Candidatus Litorirhabdus singularis TaxID=2518993 RepID=A0ABT3TCD4_9GAMM|nr:hypothetical protein [Candidatus Litorirhabdus singularis]MCX2979942.1 hypothetical protein [Candidatus Litorirhabdus singularis]
MGTDTIRQIIAGAKREESRSGILQNYFSEQLPELSLRLLLPETHPAQRLVGFVEQYIDYVPEFIDSATTISRRTKAYAYAAPFLHIAEDYFLTPPDDLSQASGLLALLDESFLAQRLLEEVNERHNHHFHQPLLPVDMMRANIIVHHLIGDELANRLDSLVDHTVKRLVDREHLFEQQRYAEFQPQQAAANAWQELPCLSRNADIELRLTAELSLSQA